jgi:hypothetical protein
MSATTYIIPSGNLTAVKAKLQQGKDLGLAGLPGMFTTPLSPTGTGNATHYVSSGSMSTEEEAWLEDNLPQSLFVYKGLHAVDDGQGGTVQVEWTPWAAFDDKGLKIVSPPI